MYEFTEEQKDWVLAEIGYSRKQLDSDLEQIKEWLKQQQHLPACRLKESDNFLKNYLTGCKGSLEKTKRKLDAYYTFRSHSELFTNRDPLDPQYVQMRQLMTIAPVPAITEGRQIILVYGSITKVDPEGFHFLPFLRALVNSSELWLREVGLHPQLYLLGNFDKFSVQHIMKMKPLLLRDMVYYLLNEMPFRIAKISLINCPSFTAAFMNKWVKPFLSKKVRDRLYITSNGIEEVIQDLENVPLPEEYGGDLPLRQLSEQWREEEAKRRQWYLNELSEQCDESKRVVSEDPTNPYFGVPGSLKKLVVD
ncbi:retinaldehyde-binding protein 1-like [Rhodnius prolixus]|uniref:retinaldehyde-binding protein 1-like n=1 Tax=Rhodnius prolixus TaxID=13249 RepID=UPI003D18958A